MNEMMCIFTFVDECCCCRTATATHTVVSSPFARGGSFFWFGEPFLFLPLSADPWSQPFSPIYSTLFRKHAHAQNGEGSARLRL